MASAQSTRLERLLHRIMPFLFKKCWGDNYHWRWDRLCFCMENEHCGNDGGAILDLKTGDRYSRQMLAIHPKTNESIYVANDLFVRLPEGFRWF